MTSPLISSGLTFYVLWPIYISAKEVRGRHQTSLLGAVRPIHQQHGGARQPAEDPRRPGGCEGWAEDAGWCPRCFVMIIPVWSVVPLLLFGFSLLCFATCVATRPICSSSCLCCASTYDAVSHELLLDLMLASWLIRLQPNKTSNRSAGMFPKIKKVIPWRVWIDLWNNVTDGVSLARLHMPLCWWKK